MQTKNTWWLGILIGFLVYAGLIEPFWIKVETHHLTIPGFPEEAVVIVHIADTHTAGIGLRERKLASIVSEFQPDYVFITGDLVLGKGSLDRGLEFTSMLEAREGVFAVCGNADGPVHFARQYELLPDDTAHLRFLFNESVDCGEFILVGIDDPVTYRARPKEALANVDGSKPVVVLVHFHPDDLLDELAKAGVDLVLSAHTHGGQIGIPALVRLVPYASRSEYISGLFDLGEFHLNVTRGIGTNIFPFRFLCRPQVDIFYITGTGD